MKIKFAIVLAFLCACCSASNLIYEWVSVDYTWQSPAQKLDYIKDGKFIVENNAITGVKYFEGDYYVTVPRWRVGVPSTLNKVVEVNGDPVLQPYPSWEMQEIGNPSALQYVQSMEIDSRGWMWIIDVGRMNFLSDPSLIVNGLAKLLIWDMKNNCSIREYVFPNDVMEYDNSFANDIVVDETNGFAYISNTWGDGGVVIYDFNKNDARRWNNPTLGGNSTNIITINGISYNVPQPSDGIALSHDTKTLYYCSLSKTHMYSVPTRVLQDFENTDDYIGQFVTYLGEKGYSDGMAVSDNGALYYGFNADSAVYYWNMTSPNVSNSVLVQNSNTMQWADTFAFDGKGNLVFTSNKLPEFIFGGMKFDGSDGANFRIWSVPIEGNSYLTGKPVPPSMQCRIAN